MLKHPDENVSLLLWPDVSDSYLLPLADSSYDDLQNEATHQKIKIIR